MAPLQRATSLEDACLSVVCTLIQNIIQNHHRNNLADEAQLMDDIKMVVNNVPPALHDQIAVMHLHAIIKIFDEVQYLNDEKDNSFYVCDHEDEVYFDVSLKVISLLKIKKIELFDGAMPFYLLNKLIDILEKMSDVEIFSTYKDWFIGSHMISSKLLKMVASWCNLTSFICQWLCTDEILALVCKNCELLREVDVRHSLKMREPIEPLMTCKNLLTVNLDCIGLNPKHFLKLLLESKSNNLIEIGGLAVCLSQIIDALEQMKSLRTFQLQNLSFTSNKKLDIIERYLRLLPKYFPSVTDIVLCFESTDVDPLCDLHILSALKHLKEVTLRFQPCRASNTVSTFLISCPYVAAVHFGHVYNYLAFESFPDEVSLFIPELIIRYFPARCLNRSYRFNEGVRHAIKPFQNLTHLIWSSAPSPQLMDILCYATNIKIIEFLVETLARAGTTVGNGILLTDEFFRSVLKKNPLNQLQNLYIDCPNSLTQEMMMYIIKNCEKLTSLSIRDSNPNCLGWSKLRKFISQNNYNVDFKIITAGTWCKTGCLWSFPY